MSSSRLDDKEETKKDFNKQSLKKAVSPSSGSFGEFQFGGLLTNKTKERMERLKEMQRKIEADSRIGL